MTLDPPQPLIPIRYVKVRADGRTFYLLLTRDDSSWLSGWEVSKEGERSDRLHLIARSAITSGEVKITRMQMNVQYCELERLDKSPD